MSYVYLVGKIYAWGSWIFFFNPQQPIPRLLQEIYKAVIAIFVYSIFLAGHFLTTNCRPALAGSDCRTQKYSTLYIIRRVFTYTIFSWSMYSLPTLTGKKTSRLPHLQKKLNSLFFQKMWKKTLKMYVLNIWFLKLKS